MLIVKKIIEQFNKLFVKSCLLEEESYATRSRKIFSITIAVGAFNGALLLGIPATVLAALYDPSFEAYLVGALLLLVSIACSVIPYTYLRYTKKLPDWLVEMQIWTALVCTFVLLLFVHQGSVTIIASCAVLLGVILRVRAWPVIILSGVAFNVIHALINDFSDHLPALHETFYSTQLLSVRIMYLLGSNVSPLVCVGFGLQMIMMEFVQRSEQADAAIAMNLAVADKLRRYDTDGVAEILAANKGKVDENLLEAFTAIQHNLQEYRPHIPDYVIAATLAAYDAQEGDSEGDGDNDDDYGEINYEVDSCDSILHIPDNESEDTCILSNQALKDADDHDDNDDEGNDNYSSNNTNNNILTPRLHTTNNKRRSNCASETGSHVATSVGDGSVYSPSEPSNTSISSRPSSKHNIKQILTNATSHHHHVGTHHHATSPNHHTSNPESTQEGRTRQHFYGRATTVFVRFVSTPCGSDGSGNGFVSKGSAVSAMNILSKCVDAGSKLAKAHGGALQYMQGCGLMVSFNAASRVAAHESKACAFALGLKAIFGGEPVVMHASIVTTNVLSFFAGNSGQLMLTVLGGFMPQHTAMHHYLSQTVGNETSCVLLSDTVVPAIEMLYEHRLLGGLQFQRKLPDAHYTPLTQLLTHRKAGNDEWLYQGANRSDSDPVVMGNNVVLAALAGALDCVVDLSIPHTTGQDEPDIVFQKCVTERIADCRQNGNTFYSSMVPPVMW